jgi:hypothetical protein
MNGISFGFAQSVTGGGNAVPKPVNNAEELRKALAQLKPDGPTVIEIVAGKDKNAYDFGSGAGGTKQTIEVKARNLTLRPSGAPVLKNVRLSLDCNVSDNILISDLVFRSEGAADGARDAIDIVASKQGEANKVSRVRITHCSFNGYYDIAVDFNTDSEGPKVLATIDHCFFYDDVPGELGPGKAPFKNRGSINISAKDAPLGNAFVTVANNVYIDVWRRQPRVARECFAHIYNNLLYRWGFTNKPREEGEWRGMEVGGGKERVMNTVDGTALIQANRFIPWVERLGDDRELLIHKQAHVDLAGATPLPNRFDNEKGKEVSSPITVPSDLSVTLQLDRFYKDVDENFVVPAVTAKDKVAWGNVLREAGPTGVAIGKGDAREALQKFLEKAP